MDTAMDGKPSEGSARASGWLAGNLPGIFIGSGATVIAALVALLGTYITSYNEAANLARDAEVRLTEIRTATTDRVRDAEVKLAEVRATAEGRARDADVRLVEIGVGVLRAKPDETGAKAARQWAIELVEKRSGVRFSEEAKAQLLDKPLQTSRYDAGGRDYNTGDYYIGGHDYDTGNRNAGGTDPDAPPQRPAPRRLRDGNQPPATSEPSR